MIILYRISDGSYPKVKFDRATKRNCFSNFAHEFIKKLPSNEHTIELYLDNVTDETFDIWTEVIRVAYRGYDVNISRSHGGSSAAGFRVVFDAALALPDDEYVYFVEDDYIHLPGSRTVLMEGLEKCHYVTLYNHPDKYIPASQGGNPFIDADGAEATKVFVTKSSYWMLTNSTTMTFATQVKTLREDKDVWEKYITGSYPQDMQIFLELRKLGRSLAQPIPTKSTHALPEWAAHLIGTGISSWEGVL